MAPEWFTQSIAQEADSVFFDFEGARSHYLRWSNPDKPSLIFVHGHAAHAHWWDFIAPAFLDSYDIVAIDMMGSGDSEHLDEYSVRGFARQIIATADHAGMNSPTLVGHSFGGAVARTTCFLFPGVFSQLILVDSFVPTRKGNREPPSMPRKRERFYASRPEGMKRFRLRPPQPRPAQFIIDHIAAHSLRESEEGWKFKLDTAVFAKMPGDPDMPTGSDMVKSLEIPVSCIYGELSLFFTKESVASMEALLGKVQLTAIPDAYHHVFLDQPQRFITSLKNRLL